MQVRKRGNEGNDVIIFAILLSASALGMNCEASLEVFYMCIFFNEISIGKILMFFLT